jgi:hypothetical protein
VKVSHIMALFHLGVQPLRTSKGIKTPDIIYIYIYIYIYIKIHIYTVYIRMLVQLHIYIYIPGKRLTLVQI